MAVDDYLKCKEYRDKPRSETFPDFTIFQHSDDQYYFARVTADGDVQFISQGYASIAARDNGIESVIKNYPNEERYKPGTTDDGKHYLSLRAGNNQEIARTCLKATAAEAAAYLPSAGGNSNDSSDSKEVYLRCSAYEGHPDGPEEGVKFFESEGLYFFATFNQANKVVLRSQGYKSAAARKTGLESVKKNRDDRDNYQERTTSKQRTYFSLRAGNGQEIARTCPNADRSVAMAVLPGARPAKSAAPTTASSSPVGVALGATDGGSSAASNASTSNKQIDEYLDCAYYKGHEEVEPGITTFTKDGEHYFAFVRKDGSVRLRSESYPTTGARDNGIESVKKHLNDADRYKTRQSAKGRWYLSLTAGNNQEIARTCTSGSREDALKGLPTKPEAPKPAAPKPAAPLAAAAPVASESMRKVDEYLPCKAYAGHDEVEPGITTFSQDGEHYFAFVNKDGSVRLRSEGYPTTGARNNGIESVKKHLETRNRYQVRQTKKGKWYLMLTAANNQEIARTCEVASRDEAKALMPAAPEPPKPAPKPEPVAAAAPAPVAAPKTSNRNVEEYLPCKEYAGHEESPAEGFRTFEQDDMYYFAVLDKDGKVFLRSESYPSRSARDTGLRSVQKHMDDDKRYKLRQSPKGKWYLILIAANNQEIARTCEQKDRAAARALRPGAFAKPPKAEKPVAAAAGLAAAAALAATPPPPPPAPEPEPPKTPEEREDDYLPCKQYANRKVNDKRNNVAFFKHKNGQYYFAIYHKNGRVRLRSEGFETAKSRDQELSGALRYLDNEEYYTEFRRKGYRIRVLHDDTGREVGRSCAEKIGAAAAPVAAAVAAAAVAAPVVAAATPPPPPPKKAAPVPPPAAAAAKGGFPWWLLGLLALLLMLLLFWCGGCGDALGCGGTAVGDDDATTTSVVTPPAEVDAAAAQAEADAAAAAAAAAAEAEAAAAAATCNCNAMTHPTFDLPPAGTSAKVLSRLGTNPEFGDSHSLSPEQFLQKLKRKYNASGVDKRYLDGVYRAMGYSGFADADAGQFSSTKLRRGQRGNMGYGPNHGTVYAQINVNDRDLQAFKIEAANGCDLHFMKTCGNHFFFCPN